MLKITRMRLILKMISRFPHISTSFRGFKPLLSLTFIKNGLYHLNCIPAKLYLQLQPLCFFLAKDFRLFFHRFCHGSLLINAHLPVFKFIIFVYFSTSVSSVCYYILSTKLLIVNLIHLCWGKMNELCVTLHCLQCSLHLYLTQLINLDCFFDPLQQDLSTSSKVFHSYLKCL